MTTTAIRICGGTWEVRRLDGEAMDALIEGCEDGEMLMGNCNHETAVISIRSTLPADRQALTLLHEVMHAVAVDVGVTLTEQDVASLAATLFATLRDNPALAREVGGL